MSNSAHRMGIKMTKKCSLCKKVKRFSQFAIDMQKRSGLTSRCKLCRKASEAEYRKNNQQKIRIYAKAHHQKNKVAKYMRFKVKLRAILTEIYKLLGNKCNRCGIKNKRVMTIDHIHGGGRKHRKKFNNSSIPYFKDIHKSIVKKEEKFQLLCWNCNILEAIEKERKGSIWN